MIPRWPSLKIYWRKGFILENLYLKNFPIYGSANIFLALILWKQFEQVSMFYHLKNPVAVQILHMSVIIN